MGMDTIELVMEIEDEFDLRIPDEDAELLNTCGQIHAYVLHRLRPLAGAPCVTAAAFYHLRRSICRRLGVPRSAVRPAARIHHLLEEAHAHRWPDIAKETGLDRQHAFDGAVPVFPPAPFATVGHLAKRMAFPAWSTGPAPQDDLAAQTWHRIQRIVSEQFGVPLSAVRPETHLIKDLNAD